MFSFVSFSTEWPSISFTNRAGQRWRRWVKANSSCLHLLWLPRLVCQVAHLWPRVCKRITWLLSGWGYKTAQLFTSPFKWLTIKQQQNKEFVRLQELTVPVWAHAEITSCSEGLASPANTGSFPEHRTRKGQGLDGRCWGVDHACPLSSSLLAQHFDIGRGWLVFWVSFHPLPSPPALVPHWEAQPNSTLFPAPERPRRWLGKAEQDRGGSTKKRRKKTFSM